MKVLYYDGGNHQKREIVQTILQERSIPLTVIKQNQGLVTLATLLEKQDDFQVSKETKSDDWMLPEFDLMIFHDIQDEQILEINEALKAHQIEITRKCIVTVHNRNWKIYDLLQEILQEEAYFAIRYQCQSLIQEMANFHEQDFSEEVWMPYEYACMKGALLLQQDEADPQLFMQVIQEITEARMRMINKL